MKSIDNQYSNNSFINITKKARRFFMFEDKQNSRRKIFASFWAVFFGLLIASIIYWIIGSTGKDAQDTNIFTFLEYILEIATRPGNRIDFLLFFIFFAFSGLAISIGFKSGLFNIGVSGQMSFPVIIFFTILIIFRLDTSNISLQFLIGMFFIFIILGMFIGMISGILKAFFNVHEVISTIFLNWIIAFLGRYLFTLSNKVFGNDSKVRSYFDDISGTKLINVSIDTQYIFIYIGIALLAVLVFLIWFIYSKTALGYKIKMVGLNKTNAKYVGVNEKLLIITIMSISGALSGIAGFFLIILKNKTYEAKGVPIAIGFEAIAIALIALNSPIGVVLTSIIYSFINTSQIGFSLKDGSERITTDFFPIITGIIIFMSALAIIFYKFRLMRTMIKYSYLMTSKTYWCNFKTYHISKFKYILPQRFKLISFWFNHLSLYWSFKKDKKIYEDKVYEQIKNSKDLSDDQLLELYSSLSQQKYDFNKIKQEKGLNIYYDEKNKYKTQVKNRKRNFAILKETLFLDFNKKVLTKYKTIFKIKEPIIEGEK